MNHHRKTATFKLILAGLARLFVLLLLVGFRAWGSGISVE